MKYIRTQDGRVLSVSHLEPPVKEPDNDAGSWCLIVTGVDGKKDVYATYVNGKNAWLAYETVLIFMETSDCLLKFGVGESGFPEGWEEVHNHHTLGKEWQDLAEKTKRPTSVLIEEVVGEIRRVKGSLSRLYG